MKVDKQHDIRPSTASSSADKSHKRGGSFGRRHRQHASPFLCNLFQRDHNASSSSFSSSSARSSCSETVATALSHDCTLERLEEEERLDRSISEDPQQEQRQFLRSIAEALQSVQVKDRRWRIYTYKSCFVGKDAVSLLVKKGFATNRQEALFLGRLANEEYGLFQHVTEEGKDLQDGEYFYRLIPDSLREKAPEESHSVNHPQHVVLTEDMDISIDIPRNNSTTSPSQSSFSSAQSTTVAGDGDVFTRAMHSLLTQVPVRDYPYSFFTYRQCFLGSQAVDILISSGCASSRPEAVRIGRQLQSLYGLFTHVTCSFDFQDDNLFYRFAPGVRTRFLGKEEGHVTPPPPPPPPTALRSPQGRVRAVRRDALSSPPREFLWVSGAGLAARQAMEEMAVYDEDEEENQIPATQSQTRSNGDGQSPSSMKSNTYARRHVFA